MHMTVRTKACAVAGFALAAGVAFVFFGAGRGTASGSAQPSLPTGAELEQLRAIGLNAAAANGDAHPTDGAVFASSRGDAMNATNGGVVDSNQSIYLIRLHGNFVANDARVPPGHAAPRGHVLIVVVDA